MIRWILNHHYSRRWLLELNILMADSRLSLWVSLVVIRGCLGKLHETVKFICRLISLSFCLAIRGGGGGLHLLSGTAVLLLTLFLHPIVKRRVACHHLYCFLSRQDVILADHTIIMIIGRYILDYLIDMFSQFLIWDFFSFWGINPPARCLPVRILIWDKCDFFIPIFTNGDFGITVHAALVWIIPFILRRPHFLDRRPIGLDATLGGKTSSQILLHAWAPLIEAHLWTQRGILLLRGVLCV